MKKSVPVLMAWGICLFTALPSLHSQSTKAPPPPPPQVWGPHVPGTDPEETNQCVKKCNADFEKELQKCFSLESAARADCEQPVRERHRVCFTGCPK